MKYHFLPYHIVKDKINQIVENNADAFFKNYGDIQPDYDYFDLMSHANRGYVALAVTDDVVGFAGFVIHENASHQELEAENVVFFFDKQHRGANFKDLIEFSKKELANIGIKKMTAAVKTDVLSRALKLNGFEKEFETWGVPCE